jgi:hypothetical protein
LQGSKFYRSISTIWSARASNAGRESTPSERQFVVPASEAWNGELALRR